MNFKHTISSFYKKLLDKEDSVYSIKFFEFLYSMILHQVRLEKEINKKNTLQSENSLKSSLNKKPYHISPEKICALFSDKIRIDYGVWSSEVLIEWGVLSSLDIGKAIFLLAEDGILSLSGTETLDAFKAAGLEI